MGIIRELRAEISERRAQRRDERALQSTLVGLARQAEAALSEMVDDVRGHTRATAVRGTAGPTEKQLADLRAAAIEQWHRSPVAAQRAWLTKCGAIGKGITAPAAADPGVQAIVDRLWNDEDNQLALFSHDGLALTNLLLMLEGERFLTVHYSDADSAVKIADIPASEVTAVITHPENRRQPVLYKRERYPAKWDFRAGRYEQATQPEVTYYRDLRYAAERIDWESDPAGLELVEQAEGAGLLEDVAILHVKADSYGVRGYPELARSLPWTRQHAVALSDMASIVKALAAFVWRKKINTSDASSLRAAVDILRNPPPGPAAVQVENQNTSLDPINVATGHASNQTAVAREMFLQSIRDGSFGEHWYGDATSGNLATATAMELPAVWRIEDRQQLLEKVILQLCVFAIERCVVTGDFPGDRVAGETSYAIDLDMPPPVPMTPATQQNTINGVVSAFTAGLLPSREASFQILQVLGSNNIAQLLEDFYSHLEDGGRGPTDLGGLDLVDWPAGGQNEA